MKEGQKPEMNHSRAWGFSAAISLWHFKPGMMGCSLNLMSTCTFRNTSQDHRLCVPFVCITSLRSKHLRYWSWKDKKAKKQKRGRKKLFCTAKSLLSLLAQNSKLGKLSVPLTGRGLFWESQNSTVKITVYIF